MKTTWIPSAWQTAWGLIALALIITAWKLGNGYASVRSLYPAEVYRVTLTFEAPSSAEPFYLETWIPRTNERQDISGFAQHFDGIQSVKHKNEAGSSLRWLHPGGDFPVQMGYSFLFAGREVAFDLSPELMPAPTGIGQKPYLRPSARIQSEHRVIRALADSLTAGRRTLPDQMQAMFAYVQQLAKPVGKGPEDAVLTAQFGKAEAAGKSRLLTALFRSSGVPARLVSGIDLSAAGTPLHYWVEASVGGKWIPMDASAGHFGRLPAAYLQIHYGDEPIFSSPSGLTPQLAVKAERGHKWEVAGRQLSGTLWTLLGVETIPEGFLRTLLLFPLCALIVALSRNVIGLKTFGVFLPALIAISVGDMGLWQGLAIFLGVIFITGLVHFPLERWRLLNTPRLVIMLIAMVALLLGMLLVGQHWDAKFLQQASALPIVILTLTSERFARKIEEDGFRSALTTLGHTLLVTVLCYGLCRSDFMVGMLLTFPEIYALATGAALLLGRWIGLRLLEYFRFKALLTSSSTQPVQG